MVIEFEMWEWSIYILVVQWDGFIQEGRAKWPMNIRGN